MRNRSVTAPHSLSHRRPEDELITPQLWARDRGRFIRDLGVPESCDKYLQRLEAGLSAGLEALAEAVKAGVVGIAADGPRVPRAKHEEDPLVAPARRLLDRAVGSAQLPEVLVEVDALTRFSWVLLNRPPRSESELVTLYAGLLALGSDHSAADLVRMVPSLGVDAIGRMMARIEACGQMSDANGAVLAFMHGHRIAKLWGPGLAASADMMSLDATRHLWAARIDPQRRTYAVGSYTHVLDQWGIIYDQPIVLNRRQAAQPSRAPCATTRPTSSEWRSTPTALPISPCP
ncbi:MAG: Tn3 family transposase [Novosphingobium sp.]